MPVPEVNNEHVAQAKAKLTQVFKNQPNVNGLLAAYVGQLQLIETAIWQVIDSRILANGPTGDQLDQIGPLVGQTREGRSDAAFLTAIKLQIRVNRSNGLAEDIIQIANLMSLGSGASYRDYPDYHWSVNAWDLSDPLTFKRMLAAAKAGGSYGRVIYSFGWLPSVNLTPVSRRGSLPTSYTTLTSRRGSVATAGLPVAAVSVNPS